MPPVLVVQKSDGERRDMWITMLMSVYLIILGVLDLRKRKVPAGMLWLGGLLFLVVGVYQCLQGELHWGEAFMGVLPGVGMLLLAKCSHKAGYGDGIVLMQMGFSLGYRWLLLLFAISLLLLSGVSVLLLLLKKVGRNTRMPYLTFLALTYVVGCIWGG